MVIRILFALFLLCGTAQATTYTVCSSGCTATTFTALFAAIDLAPDDIVEARADTVGGSKTFVDTITPGSNDYGSAGHPLIIRARAGDTITIQGPGNTGYGSNTVYLSGTDGYITIDGFTITNFGYSGVRILGNSVSSKIPGITIQNCYIDQSLKATVNDTTLCFFPNYATYLTLKNNTCVITNNDPSYTNQTDGAQIWNSDNVVIDGNIIIDNNVNGDGHNDGLQIERNVAGGSHDYTIKNNLLVHTKNTGGAQQLIFIEYGCGGTNYIYNNVLYNIYSGSNLFSLANASDTFGTFYIYNNTFYNSNGASAVLAQAGTIYFKNNIVYVNGSGYAIGMSGATVPSEAFRNNVYYAPSNANAWQFLTWDAWKATGKDNGTGADASYNADPKFVSRSAYPFNLTLQSSSPVINAGANLSSIFNTDILGNARTVPWTIGAYEYTTGGGDTTAPVIDNLSPSGVQACTSNPRNVTLSLTTNENATARMSTTDIAYSSMTDTFTTTGSTSHNEVKSLACGASYTYYVRASDAAGNANTSSSTISFSIASPQIAGPGGLRITGGRLTN